MKDCPHCKHPPKVLRINFHYEMFCWHKMVVGLDKDKMTIDWDRWANGITKS